MLSSNIAKRVRIISAGKILVGRLGVCDTRQPEFWSARLAPSGAHGGRAHLVCQASCRNGAGRAALKTDSYYDSHCYDFLPCHLHYHYCYYCYQCCYCCYFYYHYYCTLEPPLPSSPPSKSASPSSPSP